MRILEDGWMPFKASIASSYLRFPHNGNFLMKVHLGLQYKEREVKV
jgi:hypothetical protein